MTGWSIGGPAGGRRDAGKFRFRAAAHEPGARTIMGKTLRRQDGIDQALAVMKDLAASPHTAHHIAAKLARHFVADDPPPALVAKLEHTYLGTGGRSRPRWPRRWSMAPEAWSPEPQQVQDALRVRGLELARRRRRAADACRRSRRS